MEIFPWHVLFDWDYLQGKIAVRRSWLWDCLSTLSCVQKQPYMPKFGHVTIPKVRTYLFGQRKSLTMHAFCKSLQMIWYQTSPTFGHVFPAHFLIPPAAWWSPCCPIFSICNGCPESLRRMRLTITLKLSGSLHALQPSQALRLGDWGTGVRGCGWRLEFQSFKPSLQQAENVAQNKHTSSLWSFSRKTPKLFQAKSMTESYTVLYIIFVLFVYIYICMCSSTLSHFSFLPRAPGVHGQQRLVGSAEEGLL